MAITRYPDPYKELPYKRLVWYDCPNAGTLEIPGWQYFNQQGLFKFDTIVLVYDSVIISTFDLFYLLHSFIIVAFHLDRCLHHHPRTAIDLKFSLFIVRSKADILKTLYKI